MKIKFTNAPQYYYAKCTNTQKAAYTIIYEGLTTFKDEIVISNVSAEDISKIFTGLLLDNPIVFYVSSYNVTINYSKNIFTLCPIYKYDKRSVLGYFESISNYLSRFNKLLPMNDLYKEIHVNDYCIENIKYDYSFNKYSY